MQSLRRTAATAARKGRVTVVRQSRRYAHDEHAHGHHSEPVNESFGPGFWTAVGAIPAGFILYQISRSDASAPGMLTSLINRWTEKQEKLAEQNALHTAIMEQAGSDRVLFMNSKGDEHVSLRFPEIMNVGSPYNVPAGSQVNMDKVIAKYRQEAHEENEKKLEALRNGTLPAEQPLEEKLATATRYRGVELNRAAR